jgi:signal transduction histidine kinase
VRSRILGWSVLLLAVALAASTVTMHVFLVRQLDTRVNAELSHEIAEFRSLEAQRAAGTDTGGADGSATSVLALLRTRTSQAVLERDTVLVGLIGGRIVAISGNSSPAALGATSALRTRWSSVAARIVVPSGVLRTPGQGSTTAAGPASGAASASTGPASTGPASGTAQLALGPAHYLAVPATVPGAPVAGVFVAIVLTGGGQAGIARTTRLQAEVGGVALLLGAVLAWLIAGRVLRPLRDTTELAGRITDTDISGRIPVRGPGQRGERRSSTEIGELAHTLNRMLDRLESALTTQRTFLADVGHELRTPITIIQGNLDTLGATSDEDAQTLVIVADELARMARLVDELTLLAKSERPDFLRQEPVDLAPLTRSLAAKARALDPGDEGRFTLTGIVAGDAVLDRQRVTQAVMQLAANAVAHTPPGTPVEISSSSTDGTVEFRVADRGPGIPPDQRDRVFERFARLDSRRTEGTGLGLSIVAAIATAHGGTVRVTGTEPRGAAFVLSIPLRRPAARGPYLDPPAAPPRDGHAAAPATISAGAPR